MRRHTCFIWLLLGVGCTGGGADVGDAGVGGASTTVGAQGGEVRVEGAGDLEGLWVRLPPGVLADGEELEISVRLAEAPPADVVGAEAAGALAIELAPAELARARAVWDHLDVAIAVRRGALPDRPEAELPAAIVLASPGEAEAFHDQLDGPVAAPCVPEDGGAPYRIRAIQVGAPSPAAVAGLPTSDSVVLGVDAARAPEWLDGARVELGASVWIVPEARPEHTWNRGPVDGHVGQIIFRYLPLSVTGEPVTPFAPGAPACLNRVFEAFESALLDAGFPPIAWRPDGQEIPIQIFIYDFTASRSVQARTTMTHRTIFLGSRVMGIAAAGCFADGGRPLALFRMIGDMAHELFHIGQAVWLTPDDPWGYAQALERRTQGLEDVRLPFAGPDGEPLAFKSDRDDWLLESTARAFERAVAPVEDLDGRFGYLTAFPPSGVVAASVEVPGEPTRLYRGGDFFNYQRWLYIRFLTDQERRPAGATGDALRELAALWRVILAGLDGLAVDAPPDYAGAVEAFAASRGLRWFDFFREHMLLRGCGADCGAPADADHAFSRGTPDEVFTPAQRRFLGDPTFLEDRHWAGLADRPGGRTAPAAAPFAEAAFPADRGWRLVDGGWTVAQTTSCFFDTHRLSTVFDGAVPRIAASSLVRDAGEAAARRFPLPWTLAAPQAGVRVDVPDDLAWGEGTVWRLDFSVEGTCPATLRGELWTREGDRLARLQSGLLGAGAGLTAALAAPGDDRELVLLIGNDAAGPARYGPPGGAPCELVARATMGGACAAPGRRWRAAPPATAADLLAVDFASNTRVFAAGEGGTLLRSDDAGQTWRALDLGVTGTIWDVSFADADSGYAIVGADGDLPPMILATHDGGERWDAARTFTSRSRCPCAERPCAAPVGEPLPDPEHDCVDPFADEAWRAVLALSPSTALVSASRGYLYRTDDGGGTWRRAAYVDAANGPALPALAIRPSGFGLLGGHDGPDGVLYRTQDGGGTWAPVPGAPWLADVALPADALAYGAQQSAFGAALLVSRDRGATWQDFYVPVDGDGLPWVVDFAAVATGLDGGLVAVGGTQRPEGAGGFITSSLAGGALVDAVGVSPGALTAVDVACPDACAVGRSGTIVCWLP